MKTIRQNVFETNSSSTHTLAILPNSAQNVPVGQTIELKFTKKDKYEYEIDSNWKLFLLFNSSPELTLDYLNQLNINVIISLKDLDLIKSELYWNTFEFDLNTLNEFTSYVWGKSESKSFDNNDSQNTNEFINTFKNKGYIVQSYNE